MSERYRFKEYVVSILAIRETNKSRVVRGDWRSLILGYRYEVRLFGEPGIEMQADGFDTEELAKLAAEKQINEDVKA